MTGIYTACKKRPIVPAKLQEIVDDIETQISKNKGDEVRSQSIGELVMKALHDIDEVAYMRFASVYRNFSQISEFLTEINGMGDTSIGLEKIKTGYKH
jgi:transcriptional repressor NrdR